MPLTEPHSLDVPGSEAAEGSPASEIVRACRVLFASGLAHHVWGFVAVRDESNVGAWLTTSGVGFEEIDPRHVVLARFAHQGHDEAIDEDSEGAIALEIMASRPDVNAVVHAHPLYATAFSVTGRPLAALSHEGCHLVAPDLARWGPSAGPSDARDIARGVGDRNAALLVGHGLVTAGATLGEAVALAIYLEKACQLQLMVGEKFHRVTDRKVADKRSGQMGRPRISWEYLRRTTSDDGGVTT